MKAIPILTDEQQQRFWSKIDRRGLDECWDWQAGTYDGFRGRFSAGGLDYVVPRVVYFLVTGQQPDIKDVCHTCDNPRCCNPMHLWLGTRGENNSDRADKGRSAPVRGESNPRAKLTEEDVIYIRQSSDTCVSLGDHFGVDQSLISRIRLRKCWRHI